MMNLLMGLLFKLNKDDFEKLDRVGDKSINNYLTSINSGKNVMFNKFIYALGIQEVGESSSKSIAKKFNSIDGCIYWKKYKDIW